MTERDKEFERQINRAKTKELSEEESQKLLDEIRGGNVAAIEKLVDSFEVVILRVADKIEALHLSRFYHGIAFVWQRCRSRETKIAGKYY